MLARTHPLSGIPASFPRGLRWYAIYTAARAEREAEESIRDMGFPVFVPFEKHKKFRAGRKVEFEAALFPRYGFVQFDINHDRWGAILDADEVVDVCRIGAIPRRVPDAMIDALKLAVGMGAFDRTKPPKIGLPAEITEGPFAGFIGKIVRARSGDRVDVLIDFLGQKVDVDVSLAHLREA